MKGLRIVENIAPPTTEMGQLSFMDMLGAIEGSETKEEFLAIATSAQMTMDQFYCAPWKDPNEQKEYEHQEHLIQAAICRKCQELGMALIIERNPLFTRNLRN